MIDHSPFVGRQSELAELLQCVDAAGSGWGQVALVSGEPGVGKSRLVREFAAQISATGWHVLLGGALESEGMPAYLPIAGVLRGYVAACPAEVLRTQLGPGAADVALLVREVATRLPVGQRRGRNPTQARYELFESVAAFLSDVALKFASFRGRLRSRLQGRCE